MTVDLNKVRIYIRPGHTDLRKAVNGLTLVVQEQMGQDPFSESVYIFCNRDRRVIKAVWWDRTGFWLSQKPPTRKRVLGAGQVSLARKWRGGRRTEPGTGTNAVIGDRLLESA
jgi:hypothetical protein